MRVLRVARRRDLATRVEYCTNCAMIDDDVLSAPVLYLCDARSRAAGEVAELARNDAGHVKALRLAPEDPVRVTDGHGVLWGARLLEGGSSVRLLDRLQAPPRLEVELWAPVGNKQATLWLVEKAAEFGLRRLRPVECRRSVSVADASRSRGFWAKAERRVLAAVKQSGSAWTPELDEPVALADRLAGLEGDRPRFVLDRTGPPLAAALAGWSCTEPVVLLIGPEGGLTGEERVACERDGFRPASLGPTVLRFETAAVAALAIAAQRSLAARNETSTEGSET